MKTYLKENENQELEKHGSHVAISIQREASPMIYYMFNQNLRVSGTLYSAFSLVQGKIP